MREYLRMSEYRKVTISGRCRQSAGKILSANADRRHTQNERGKSRESAHALFCVIQRHVRVYPRLLRSNKRNKAWVAEAAHGIIPNGKVSPPLADETVCRFLCLDRAQKGNGIHP